VTVTSSMFKTVATVRSRTSRYKALIMQNRRITAEVPPSATAGSTDHIPDYRRLLVASLLADGLTFEQAERAQLVFSLVRLFNRLSQDYEAAHRKLGWSWAGFRVLNLLGAVGPMESRELIRASGSSRASMASLLNTLEHDGLVERTRSFGDRRQVVVSLTADGAARLVAGIRAQAECDEAWFSRLDTQQELDLEQTLTALADQPPPAAVSTDPYGAPQALAHSHRD
jgi:DNA-binding MarR family transcriptional regulator